MISLLSVILDIYVFTAVYRLQAKFLENKLKLDETLKRLV